MSKKPIRSRRDGPLFRPLSPRETVKIEAWDELNTEKLEEWEGPTDIADAASAHFKRGLAAYSAHDYDAALAEFRQVMHLMPDFGRTHLNFGVSLAQKSEFAAAVFYLEEAIRRSPNDRDAHFDLALCTLGEGDFERGWREYEWRPSLSPNFLPAHLNRQPRWDGSPLGGKTLLVHAEQGYGDTFQFARYLALIPKDKGAVIFAVQKGAMRLMESSPALSFDSLVCRDDAVMPKHDLQIPLLSLPQAFGTRFDTIPDVGPYLKPDEAEAAAWRDELSSLTELRIGLAWAGNSNHSNDKRRSMTLADLEPLAGVKGVTRFSLQKGEPSSQIRKRPELLDFVPMLTDFADTAALIANLDLVITVDTSIAHLAGAMGKPVWVLLPHAAEWRWFRDRSDSPWYPSMRLWRQIEPGNWRELAGRVAAELRGIADSR